MYTEDYRGDDFPYRKFYLKLILIVIAVALVICIITAIYKKNNEVETESGTDAVFSENLEEMRIKALKYYNESNIPKEVGESSKLTLDRMISTKLVTPIKDKNQKLCDNSKSYIKLTKKENEYLLKVNLVCSEDKDYMILHLNNNSYCDGTYLCEIKATNEEEEKEEESVDEVEVDKNINDNNTSSTASSIPKKSSKTTTTTTTKRVRKTEVIQTSKGSITVTDTTNEYIYEYAKKTNPTFSNWSLWSNWEMVSCSTKAITCNDTDVNCLKELKRYDRKEKLDNETEDLYGTVCYKSERTRTVTNKGEIIKKWSKYNDKTLLKNGYYYTGNRKK